MSTSVCEREQGIRDRGEHERTPRSGLFGNGPVKRMLSNGNIFFFEVPNANG